MSTLSDASVTFEMLAKWLREEAARLGDERDNWSSMTATDFTFDKVRELALTVIESQIELRNRLSEAFDELESVAMDVESRLP